MRIEDIVNNARIYGLEESVIASGYPMLTEALEMDEFINLKTELVENSNNCLTEHTENAQKHYKRADKLANTPMGSGHSNYLKGIVVQFDLTFTVKAWTEAERYHWFDFVSSMSSMHRLIKMDYDKCFIGNVTENTKNEMKRLLAIYNENPTAENKLNLLYNCPTGLKLTARMTTNYLQLRTVYHQRWNHQLLEWRVFCAWIKSFPHSEWITGCRRKSPAFRHGECQRGI